MKPIIKWPGGKSREIRHIKEIIPEHDRYIEPFFGGGAVFFDLMPSKALINDISVYLTTFYKLIKEQDDDFKDFLIKYDQSFQSLLYTANKFHNRILNAYEDESYLNTVKMVHYIISQTNIPKGLIIDFEDFMMTITNSVEDKFKRTKKNNEKKVFIKDDLIENLITGFTSGYYLYFRKVYNDISLGRVQTSEAYKIANFYFIREYCYGSMFRYNKNGEFNIPYGGMSYNRKQFSKKIDSLFNDDIEKLFKNVYINNSDFEFFLNSIELTSNDFMFLDPPYDTDFSEYDRNSFDLQDQERLCNYLKSTPAKFILIIKNTDFIYNLYKYDFKIRTFDKSYTYNVRSRNDRNVTHLIITNY